MTNKKANGRASFTHGPLAAADTASGGTDGTRPLGGLANDVLQHGQDVSPGDPGDPTVMAITDDEGGRVKTIIVSHSEDPDCIGILLIDAKVGEGAYHYVTSAAGRLDCAAFVDEDEAAWLFPAEQATEAFDKEVAYWREWLKPTSDAEALNARWEGQWVNRRGFIYHPIMEPKVGPDNVAEGRIDWTLEKSPRRSDQPKLGRRAVEFVQGTYDPGVRPLSLEGYRKDDPHQIVVLDRYRLLLAENRKVLGGITKDNGAWRGMLSLARGEGH
jgi:hypothetical protein